MKIRKLGVALVAAAMTLGTASAFAQDTKDSDPNRMCLRSTDIRSSHVVDDQNIQFEMRNGQKWTNKLTDKCVGLYINDGFSYNGSPNGDICANLQAIKVLHSGNVCLLGSFHKS